MEQHNVGLAEQRASVHLRAKVGFWSALGSAVVAVAACNGADIGGALTPGEPQDQQKDADGSSQASADPGSSTVKPQGGDSGTGEAPQVAVDTGKLQGKVVGQTAEFLGIPYAKPPIGEGRFAPSRPAEPWSGLRDATAFGPVCPQYPSPMATPGPQSEDCLTLNVFVPKSAQTGDRLAVMVYIHGGAFIGGGGSAFDMQNLSEAGHVVGVDLNYRLGALGFFSHPELDKARPANSPSGNDGLRDQQLALDWVKRNIGVFGGDPSNVTVFGESAGSMSTCLQMVSPTSRALAQRFIMESASCTGGLPILDKAGTNALSKGLGDELCAGASDVLACLRSKSADELVAWRANAGISGAGWAPSYDPADPFMPGKPAALIAEGNFNRGGFIIGSNKNEWGIFRMDLPPIATTTEFATAVDAQFPAVADQVKAHYVVPTDAQANDVYIRLMTDAMFRCPSRKLARLATAGGAKTFLYSFEEGPAFHALELGYVFGPLLCWSPPCVESLQTTMQSYWTTYAKNGDPNSSAQPAWPTYEAGSDRHMILKAVSEPGSGLSKDDCDFWDGLPSGSLDGMGLKP